MEMLGLVVLVLCVHARAPKVGVFLNARRVEETQPFAMASLPAF